MSLVMERSFILTCNTVFDHRKIVFSMRKYIFMHHKNTNNVQQITYEIKKIYVSCL